MHEEQQPQCIPDASGTVVEVSMAVGLSVKSICAEAPIDNALS